MDIKGIAHAGRTARGDRLAAWSRRLAGLAAVLTMAGCSGEADVVAPAAVPAPVQVASPPALTTEVREARLAEIREKRIEAARLEQEARMEADRDREARRQAGGRCIGGVLYRKQGNAWVEEDRC
ncbi:hypothetical protein [Marilutibacter spongiae]|uniref:Uncharacterized protein n=1 Tax=Marilutibacter spongiae TaxID=2025720 RepID=A0A7W3Y4D4_9GAMM|nr:hypothetical protein [Lysobacter spongiae]MBB1059278.1 hypothetical protein [Lysobacter spongiae]